METVEPLPLSIDELPSYEEELALEWTLSLDDIQFILHTVKGAPQILYFASALKSLKNSGTFLNTEKLSKKIITYLAKQLNVPITAIIKISDKSRLLYQQKIKNYLDYSDFGIKQESALKTYVQQELQKELFSLEILKEKACDFLKRNKIMRPAPTILERIIVSYRKDELEQLYETLASKLTAEQKTKILAL